MKNENEIENNDNEYLSANNIVSLCGVEYFCVLCVACLEKLSGCVCVRVSADQRYTGTLSWDHGSHLP